MNARVRPSLSAMVLVLALCLGSFAAAPGGPDTSPPVVAITAPRAGDTLTDDVTVTATASDDTAVAGVQFLLDGQPLGSEVTAPPYEVAWRVTARAQSGFHQLSALARDAAGHRTTSTAIEVDVQAVDASHPGPNFKSQPLPSLSGRLGITLVDWHVPGLAMVPETDPTPTRLLYLPFNRDPVTRHDRVWYRTHHPHWVMYKCDRTRPATIFGSPLVVLDIASPEVRDYQLNVWARVGVKQGLAGVFFDNLAPVNAPGSLCGHYAKDRAWVAQYSGAVDDAAWPGDVEAWLASVGERVRALGGVVAANVAWVAAADAPGRDLKDWYERIAARLDAVLLDGGGFVDECRPRAGQGWRDRFETSRLLVQGGRGLMIQDVACDTLADLTQELKSWMFANYLLVRGDKTYVTIVPRRGLVFYDGAEYYLPIGAPAGEPLEHGGVWTRTYEHGLVAVNPDLKDGKPLELGSAAYVDIKGARVEGGQLASGEHLFNGRTVTGTVTLPPASGLVLLARGIETLTASIPEGRAPLTVTFTGYLVNGSPACARTDWYSLTFGDGRWDFVTVPAGTCGPYRYSIVHAYARPGAYDVVLSRPSRALPARRASIALGHAPVKVTP